ncbi:MAG: DNA polymerase III subunit epsilon [Rhizobiaceae bacterium]
MAEALREIIFDTETTGLNAKDGDRVIEIGAIELVNRFPTGNTFHMFVNPEGREVHPDALEIHGISNDFLADKPTFMEIFEDFRSFFDNSILVAHNASFDMGFLNAELVRIGQEKIEFGRVVDTLLIARRKFPGQRNSLDALCARFSIDNSRREKHGALLDSELLADVYLELLGGKQASFELDPGSAEEVPGDRYAITNVGTVVQRPKPLPSRLTEEDIEHHKAFIDTFGDNAIWKRTGNL